MSLHDPTPDELHEAVFGAAHTRNEPEVVTASGVDLLTGIAVIERLKDRLGEAGEVRHAITYESPPYEDGSRISIELAVGTEHRYSDGISGVSVALVDEEGTSMFSMSQKVTETTPLIVSHISPSEFPYAQIADTSMPLFNMTEAIRGLPENETVIDPKQTAPILNLAIEHMQQIPRVMVKIDETPQISAGNYTLKYYALEVLTGEEHVSRSTLTSILIVGDEKARVTYHHTTTHGDAVRLRVYSHAEHGSVSELGDTGLAVDSQQLGYFAQVAEQVLREIE